MNDFASRFLETLDNETDAFWCFVGYMRRSAWSFTTIGVRRKIRERKRGGVEDMKADVTFAEQLNQFGRTLTTLTLFLPRAEPETKTSSAK